MPVPWLAELVKNNNVINTSVAIKALRRPLRRRLLIIVHSVMALVIGPSTTHCWFDNLLRVFRIQDHNVLPLNDGSPKFSFAFNGKTVKVFWRCVGLLCCSTFLFRVILRMSKVLVIALHAEKSHIKPPPPLCTTWANQQENHYYSICASWKKDSSSRTEDCHHAYAHNFCLHSRIPRRPPFGTSYVCGCKPG